MEVTVQNIDLTPLANRLKDMEKPVLEASARGISVMLVKHFRERNKTPNKKGFPRSNYWSAAADSVTTTPDDGTASVVTIAKEGVRLHWKGGEVKPVKGKNLAIPADASVAGIWPSEYAGAGGSKTFLAWPKGKRYGFIAESGAKPLHVLWWLKESTHHEPEPSVIPAETDMKDAALRAARSALRAAIRMGKTA